MNELIDKCLYNWLGYGNLNGDIWFIGTEEGGAEIWRDLATLTLEESLQKRSKFPLTCNFSTVWEDVYGVQLNKFSKITTWHFMSAFLLAIANKNVNSESVKELLYVKKELGSIQSNNFMCELFPLPKKSKNEMDFPYKSRWINSNEYKAEVIDNRFSMIVEAITKSSGAKLIIVYDKDTQDLIKNRFDKNIKYSSIYEYVKGGKRKQKFEMHYGSITNKNVMFLFTPFFGFGQISYDAIIEVVKVMKKESSLP